MKSVKAVPVNNPQNWPRAPLALANGLKSKGIAKVSYNFGGSQTLAAQLGQGAQADVGQLEEMPSGQRHGEHAQKEERENKHRLAPGGCALPVDAGIGPGVPSLETIANLFADHA